MLSAPSGNLFRFVIIWMGQLVSLVGSSITGFALAVWTYQKTGSVMQFGWVLLAGNLPAALIAPFAGAIVDRHSRRSVLLLCDLGSALGTGALLLLVGTGGELRAWHIYLFNAYLSALSAVHWPAYCAAMTLMVPTRLLGNINGMLQLSKALGQVSAPFLGGVLLALIELRGVLLVDGITFFVAFAGLLCIRIPEAPVANAPTAESKVTGLWRDVRLSWRYLAERPGLAWLMTLSATSNLLLGMVEVLVIPLALAITSPIVLGTLMTIGGVGMLAGGVTLSVWGGPKRRIQGVLVFDLITGVCVVIFGLLLELDILGVVIFTFFFSLPLTNGCAQAILQQKVALDMQGRVFAIGAAAVVGALPLAYVIAGPLVEHIFNPLLHGNSTAPRVIKAIIGEGPEQGTRALLVLVGLLSLAKTVLIASRRGLVQVEKELPDARQGES